MRVIAGSARGRPLRAPTGGTRPTADKIKGVIFSMLEAEAYRRGFQPEMADDEAEGDGRFAAAVAWPRVLELYAGSGSLAIEALSRGASHADLVEPSAAVRKAIAANLERTGLTPRATIRSTTSETAVSTLAGPYDLILADPPYDKPEVATVLGHLLGRPAVTPSAVMVWEHRRTTDPPDEIGDPNAPLRWRRARTNTHGAAAVSLYLTVAAR